MSKAQADEMIELMKAQNAKKDAGNRVAIVLLAIVLFVILFVLFMASRP